jgi:hypothetical protein
VRNRWGDTSTPIVSRVILEISVPRFFVVSRSPVVEEIQRAFVGGLISLLGRELQLQSVEAWPMQPCNSRAEVGLRAQSLYHCVCLQQ